MNSNQLKNTIIEAFKDTQYPGDDNIAADERDLEFESLKEFVGINWQDITVNFLSLKHSSSLCIMTTSAYAYYVPAYMLASIEDYDKSDLIPNNLISWFTFSMQQDIDKLNAIIKKMTDVSENKEHVISFNADEENARFAERTECFSDKQKNAIYQYLLFLNKEHGEDYPENEPQVAIDRYWRHFGG